MDWKSTLVLTLVNTFAGLAFGFSFVGINIALNVLYPCALQMADDEKWRYALLMSAMNFGAIFGSPLTAPIDRLVTRKYTMVLGGASGAIVTIASAFAPTYVGQIIPRIIGGMSIGVISATAPNYVSDNASPNIRGVLGSSFQFALNFAIIAGSLASYFVLGEHRDLDSSAYRIALGVEALAACEYKLKILLLSSSVPYILITLFFLLPIFPRDRSERELIMNSLDCEELLTTVAFVRPIRGWILNLSLAACNQLSGISAVLFYCNVFLSTAHVRAVMLGTVIIMSWNLLSSLFPLWMSKKCNRRPVLICSTGITGFALLLLPLAGRFLPVQYAASMSLAIIAIYLLSFQCGIGSLYWIMCNEIYPESFPFINALTWTMATGVVLIFPVLQSMMGLFVFCVFSALSFICLLIFIFMLPETRDKPLSEIRQILNQPGWIVR